jgi:hypothetical protein
LRDQRKDASARIINERQDNQQAPGQSTNVSMLASPIDTDRQAPIALNVEALAAEAAPANEQLNAAD